MSGQLRGMETRIAEDMTSVLDYVSRVKRGIDGGEWHYVLDKAAELARAAQRLSDAAGYEIEERRAKPRQAARPKAIIDAITRYARHYVAGRALYPAPVDPEAEERRARIAANVADILGSREGVQR
jgi:alpha-D-ribose 1-methylphosphonate 5-triphosphate synthase subunit PhnG